MTAPRDCLHGSLARSCPLCELQADLKASEARVKELEAERDNLRRACDEKERIGGAFLVRAERAEAVAREWYDWATQARCVYCGVIVAGQDPYDQDAIDEVKKQHILTCANHPMRSIEAELARRDEACSCRGVIPPPAIHTAKACAPWDVSVPVGRAEADAWALDVFRADAAKYADERAAKKRYQAAAGEIAADRDHLAATLLDRDNDLALMRTERDQARTEWDHFQTRCQGQTEALDRLSGIVERVRALAAARRLDIPEQTEYFSGPVLPSYHHGDDELDRALAGEIDGCCSMPDCRTQIQRGGHGFGKCVERRKATMTSADGEAYRISSSASGGSIWSTNRRIRGRRKEGA